MLLSPFSDVLNVSELAETRNSTQQTLEYSIGFTFAHFVDWLSQLYTYFWWAFIVLLVIGCCGNLWALFTLHLSSRSPEHFALTLPYFYALFTVDFLMDTAFGVDAYLENGLSRLIKWQFAGLENLSHLSCKLNRLANSVSDLPPKNSPCHYIRT